MPSIAIRSFTIFFLFFLAACSTSELTPRYGLDLTRLFSSNDGASEISTDPKDYPVHGTVFVAGDPTPAAATMQRPGILELSEDGQKAAIGRLSTDSEQIVRLFSQPLSQTRPPNRNRIQIERRLVFGSALNPRFEGIGAGDRIEHIEFAAKLTSGSDMDGQFVSWNRFETLRETISFGTLGLQRNDMVNASISPTLTGAITGAAAIGSSSARQVTEETVVSRQFDALTPLLTKNTATLIQRGDDGVEIPGLVTADITYRFESPKPINLVRFSSLFSGANGMPRNQDEVWYTFSRVLVPSASRPVQLEVSANALVRDAFYGTGRFRLEKDHWIRKLDWKVIFGTTQTAKIELVTQSELDALRERWGIVFVMADGSEESLVLKLEQANSPTDPAEAVARSNLNEEDPLMPAIRFETDVQAHQFLRWMVQVAQVPQDPAVPNGGNRPLRVRDASLQVSGKEIRYLDKAVIESGEAFPPGFYLVEPGVTILGGSMKVSPGVNRFVD